MADNTFLSVFLMCFAMPAFTTLGVAAWWLLNDGSRKRKRRRRATGDNMAYWNLIMAENMIQNMNDPNHDLF